MRLQSDRSGPFGGAGRLPAANSQARQPSMGWAPDRRHGIVLPSSINGGMSRVGQPLPPHEGLEEGQRPPRLRVGHHVGGPSHRREGQKVAVLCRPSPDLHRQRDIYYQGDGRGRGRWTTGGRRRTWPLWNQAL